MHLDDKSFHKVLKDLTYLIVPWLYDLRQVVTHQQQTINKTLLKSLVPHYFQWAE